MDRDTLILLIDESSTGLDAIRRVLGDQASQFNMRRVADVATGLARIWGGGVDMVLMDLPASTASEADRLASFAELRSKVQGVPIVILCSSADESLGEIAVREGAADYLIRESYDVDLLRVLRSVAGQVSLSAVPARQTAAGKGPKLLAFMGTKGGVGATTVALNVAADLARNHRVILAELHSELGTLAHYFQPHRSTRDLGALLHAKTIAPGAVEACLWPCKNTPGLQVVFGSRNPNDAGQLKPENVGAILALLAGFADYIVVDLPVSLSETNRAIFEASDFLALVMERDAISVHAAKQILHSVDTWNAARVSMGAVIVNRTALVSPMLISQIETQLSIPILALIPPAPDLCASVQHAHIPLVALDEDSLPALALRELSRQISAQVPLPRTAQLASAGMQRAGVR